MYIKIALNSILLITNASTKMRRKEKARIWKSIQAFIRPTRLFANVSCYFVICHCMYNCDNLQLVLNSMHKYQPRIHLVKRPDSGAAKPIMDLEKEPHKTFIFPEAIFTAVTAYQNQLVSFTLFLATVVHSRSFFLPARSLSRAPHAPSYLRSTGP